MFWTGLNKMKNYTCLIKRGKHVKTAIAKTELKEKIALLPEEKIKDVNIFIDSILAQSKAEEPKRVSLRGIWKDKGFDKIEDLGCELKKLRREMNDSFCNSNIAEKCQ